MATYRIKTDPSTNAATVTCSCGETLFTRPCRDDIPPAWGTTCPACGERHECRGRNNGDFATDAQQERVRTGFAKPETAEALSVSRRVRSQYNAEGRLISPVPTREA